MISVLEYALEDEKVLVRDVLSGYQSIGSFLQGANLRLLRNDTPLSTISDLFGTRLNETPPFALHTNKSTHLIPRPVSMS
jgi:hypothetical protein